MKMNVSNMLGEVIEIFAGFSYDTKYAWSTKSFTKNCPECPHCIGGKEAISVVRAVGSNKRRCRWVPPSEERISGVCNWGVWPKILVPRAKGPRKCEYFGKPRPV
jgi:hypothetical protein